MIVVLDASSAGEIAAKSQAGVDLVNVLMQADKVMAPDLFIAEICNVIWQLCRKGKEKADADNSIANDCIGYVDEYVSSYELWKEALRMAQEQDHPVYDMLYAVLARRHDAMVLTMDKRLYDICKSLSIRCKSAGLV